MICTFLPCLFSPAAVDTSETTPIVSAIASTPNSLNFAPILFLSIAIAVSQDRMA
jgi:hypothetical protein